MRSRTSWKVQAHDVNRMFKNGAKRERGSREHNPSWEKPQKRRVDVTVMLAEIIHKLWSKIEDRNPTYAIWGLLPEVINPANACRGPMPANEMSSVFMSHRHGISTYAKHAERHFNLPSKRLSELVVLACQQFTLEYFVQCRVGPFDHSHSSLPSDRSSTLWMKASSIMLQLKMIKWRNLVGNISWSLKGQFIWPNWAIQQATKLWTDWIPPYMKCSYTNW
jgi:hypothetical protein